MPRSTHPDPNSAELADIRARGAEVTIRLLETEAPAGELERLAFIAGSGSIDKMQEAVDACRAAGWTWPQIASAVGQNMHTVKTKYNHGYEAQRRYRERKAADPQA